MPLLQLIFQSLFNVQGHTRKALRYKTDIKGKVLQYERQNNGTVFDRWLDADKYVGN